MINITQKKTCTGCHTCASICPQSCINMLPDEEGFLYPHVDTKLCTECGLCVKACPILTPNNNPNNSLPQAYACLNNNDDIRLKSSSGGIFFLIASYILKNSGVVFGATFNKNFEVVHNYTETIDGLPAFMGSKYVQSKIGITYIQAKQFLDSGKNVLFSGTPCQIDGLKSYLQKPYENLFCIDIVCHGVPSPKVWNKYLSFREIIASSKTKTISFRNKEQGWLQYSLSFAFKNGLTYKQISNKDLYMKTFLKNISLRPSCYACQFKSLNRSSDITLADFWGIENIIPEANDNKGTSLLLINNPKGDDLFKHIRANTTYYEVDVNKAISYNLSAIKSSPQNPNRHAFFEQLDTYSFDKLIKKFCSEKIYVVLKRKVRSLISKLTKKIRNFVSLLIK